MLIYLLPQEFNELKKEDSRPFKVYSSTGQNLGKFDKCSKLEKSLECSNLDNSRKLKLEGDYSLVELSQKK